MHQQKEVVDDIRNIARKYKITYYQAENIIYSRFSSAREELKKNDPYEGKFTNVRLYKFGMFYIPLYVRKFIKKMWEKHLEKERQNNITKNGTYGNSKRSE